MCSCGNSGCGGCGALVVPEGPAGPTGAAGANGTNGTNGTNGADGAPGFLCFSFTAGRTAPYVLGGSAAGSAMAYFVWPGATSYPNAIPARIRIGIYGTAGVPDFTVQIRDTDNGNAIIAFANNVANAAIGDFSSMTINAGNISNTPATWEIFVIDNNLSNDKVNGQSLLIEF